MKIIRVTISKTKVITEGVSSFYKEILSNIVEKNNSAATATNCNNNKLNSDYNCSFNFIELDILKDFNNKKKPGNDKEFCIVESAFINYINTIEMDCFNLIKKDATYKHEILPTIFVCPFDILDENFSNRFRDLIFFPRSINFIDSSIWFRFVPFYKEREEQQKENDKDCFREQLQRAIMDIENCWKLELYKANVAIEELLLSIRLLKNSYLEAVDSHDKFVSPFVFHSESQMEKEAMKVYEKELNKELKWKVLLVDDYADIPLKGSGKTMPSKKEIIENVLKDFNRRDDNCKNIVIETVNDGINKTNSDIEENKIAIIWKTLKKLSVKSYDIILLDYLLGDSPNIKGREYSHDLLNIIDEICRGKDVDNYDKIRKFVPTDAEGEIEKVICGILKNKGPLGQFWFLNISSFESAFLDRLREQGLGHNNEHWYLSRGGDLVNTPKLFMHALFRFMKLQISFSLYDKKTILNFFEDRPIIQSDKSYETGNWARVVFGEFIHKFYSREIINHDVRNKSLFATSVSELTNKEESFREAYNLTDHFRHLLYLLAFDSALNLQIAWEELQLIKRKLGDYSIRMKDIFKEIEKYIANTLNNYN